MSSKVEPGKDIREGAGTPPRKPINKRPQFFEFAKMGATTTSEAGSKTWWVRSQAMVVAYTEGVAGDTFTRSDQLDEYMALSWGDGADLTCSAGDQVERAVDPSVVIMPPGTSEVTLNADGVLIRLFTTQSADLAALCENNALFDEPDRYVAPFAHWPDPVGGFRVRAYRLGDYAQDKHRLGRLFRCTTFMVNAFYDFEKPRPANRMSPHFHEDFEQISLTLAGDFMHHIRSPWTTDLDEWIEDEHRLCSSPSATVIPPPTVHSSRWFEGKSQLLDIFAPPRVDFSSKDGWILNADDYPMPTSPEAAPAQ